MPVTEDQPHLLVVSGHTRLSTTGFLLVRCHHMGHLEPVHLDISNVFLGRDLGDMLT